MRTKTAFTLIELLVVIAIISILAAILFPVFAQARNSARNTMDLSNIRQVGIAAAMYAQDYDEHWVPIGSWNDPTVTPYTNPIRPAPGVEWNGWGLRLTVYTKNKQVFHSPWMPDRTNWWTGPCATSNGMALTNSYAMNWLLGRDGSFPFDYPPDYSTRTPNGLPLTTPVSLAEINQPANTMAFMLSKALSPYGNDFGCDWNTLESSDFDNKLSWKAVFRDGGNLASAHGCDVPLRSPGRFPQHQRCSVNAVRRARPVRATDRAAALLYCAATTRR